MDALLKQMTLEEKLGQLVQYSDSGYDGEAQTAAEVGCRAGEKSFATRQGGCHGTGFNGRLGSMLNTVGQARTNALQHAAVEKSRLHIPLMFGADIIHGYKTVYPIPLGLAATFDPELVTALAHISATEARTGGVDWFYSPMVDISRDPRWGRTQEGAGEDAYLGAAMARAYIRGYQGDDLSCQPAWLPGEALCGVRRGGSRAGIQHDRYVGKPACSRTIFLRTRPRLKRALRRS